MSQEALAVHFGLDEKQIKAKNKHRQFVFYFHVLCQINALVKSGQLVKQDSGLIVRAERIIAGETKAQVNSGARQELIPAFDDGGINPTGDATTSIPEDSIEDNYRSIREELAAKLLNQIGESTPRFFEELVIDLLVKMGYGGSRDDAAKAVGGSGDEGIDGIINEDRLGLDVVYVQAKRWQTNVSRPELQKFAGALQGQRARKGIFITTSGFSRDAREYVNNIDSKIVLIDGRQLAEYMIDHNVGVSTVKTYEIKRVDSDYFIETDNS